LGGFENHNNYDGIFIGKPELDWHFEFTKSDKKADHFSDEDDINFVNLKKIYEFNNNNKKKDSVKVQASNKE